MKAHIFREYDIRGIINKDLTTEDAFLIGKGAGAYLARRGKKRVTVGRDCRLTSPECARQVIAGLCDCGLDVVDIGVVPTPVFYFSIHHLKADGGVMVTASHNPPEYNGFKVNDGMDSLHGSQIQEIRALIENKDFVSGKGAQTQENVNPAYFKFVTENISLKRPLKIGVDAGNGTSGPVAVPIFKALGCEVFDIYCDMDGTFPNHSPDPTVAKNMQDLIALVKENGLDLGIGFDGDGDRIGAVDENGTMIYGDQLMIIFAREILSRKPGSTIISEVKCSQTLYDDIAERGGRAIMWKTGHSLIKKKMKEEKAELAGEMSGHIFFSDRFLGFDDATYAACRLLEIVAASSAPVSALLKDVPKTFSTPEIRVDCPEEKKFAVVEKVTQYFRERFSVIDIDGVRVLFGDGWGLVRASNTQPVLVLRFEALSQNRLEEIKNIVESVVKQVRESL
ncbi:MAG: phosphomannomutase/phosphoglucomutase [Desulfatibacillaceae bacterium]|nr:phosphomannomutase/phosphoglucomutase [Desulfatibacillaceae bacterium]